MGYSEKWILLCIDGTDSKTWRSELPDGKSHVYKFYQQFGNSIGSQRIKKLFYDGPNNSITGYDSRILKRNSLEWIQNSVSSFLNDSKDINQTTITKIDKNSVDKLRIILIGHSRGGAIAIDIANNLQRNQPPVQVYFIGLFDAVDRCIWIRGGRIENTKYAYHAVRAFKNSRPLFGNTGISGLDEKSIKAFTTSHGGIGGAPELHPVSINSDYSCSVDTLSAKIIKGISKQDIGQICLEGSDNSYNWMIGNARKHGLPI